MRVKPSLLLHGNFHRPSGFTIINRKIADGFASQGFHVFQLPIDGIAEISLKSLPDVYIFHGDPYNLDLAPGRLNALFLHWEYLRLPDKWVQEINEVFDLVIAPSDHSQQVYQASGNALPMIVFPAAVDHDEFNPQATPWAAPTNKAFRFVHLGGAHERRGTDILLKAYAETFTSEDDVALILKAFHYEHYREWLEQYLALFDKDDTPEIIYIHETLPSAAGVFTAADCGVYPLRAECFGLPVLECIASGRRVIVPKGTGLDQFCNVDNADFVDAMVVEAGDKTGHLPDAVHLGKLMREAYERGKPDAVSQQHIADSTADFTWERSIAHLAAQIKVRLVDQGERLSAFSLKPYLGLSNGLPLQIALDLDKAERAVCGVPPRQLTAFEQWACQLAQEMTPAAVTAQEQTAVVRGNRIRNQARCQDISHFLFYSRNPFLDGIRYLFEAWHAARLPDAVLHCLTSKDILTSPYLLRILVQNDNIIIHDFDEISTQNMWRPTSCLVYPTLGDQQGKIVMEGLANGHCVITTAACIAAKEVTHGVVLPVLNSSELSVALIQVAKGALSHD